MRTYNHVKEITQKIEIVLLGIRLGKPGRVGIVI